MPYLQRAKQFGQHSGYWLLMVVLSFIAEAVALYYQYVLDEGPCVLCIHVRLWVAAIFLIGLAGFMLKRTKVGLITAHSLSLICCTGLLERSYQLYGVENGFIEGSCSFSIGMPSWFAVDEWLPTLFKATGICGYTPNLGFNISMAEGLLVTSTIATLVCIVVLIASLSPLRTSK